MAITSRDGWFSSAKQQVIFAKTANRTTVAGTWFTTFDLAGIPGAGTLAIGNTANGVVPTDATAGYPAIAAFGASATGYISRIGVAIDVNARLRCYDRVFAAGAYASNANTTLASIPSFSSRIPGGNYNGLELWVEQVTAATGNQAVAVTYTNQSGATGRTTGAVGIGAAPTVGRMWQLPLQAGDSGVQQITNVTGSVASAGTFNVMVLRRLWSGYANLANLPHIVDDVTRTVMRQIYADSALYFPVLTPSGTTMSRPDYEIDIVDG